MAHAQLKGVVEDMCPGSVTAELETLDPLRLLDLGVDPERSVSLYRTLYKYARDVPSRTNACATRCPRSVPTPPPSSSTTCGASTPPRGNPPRAPLSPRRLSARRNSPPSMTRGVAEDAVNALVSELGEIKDELAATTAARDDAAAEAASLRPFPTQLETQTTRARTAETERDEWKSRAPRRGIRARRRESRRGASSWRRERRRGAAATEAALRAEMTSARATAEETLFAEKRRAAEALAEPTSRLARWERERDAAAAGEKDAKKITGALRADIAFLREQRGGAEAEKQAALLRAREAEDREAKGAAIAKAAKARAEDAERRAEEAESRANAAEERYATATARSLLLTSELAKSKKRAEALENSDVKQALSMALRRAEARRRRSRRRLARRRRSSRASRSSRNSTRRRTASVARRSARSNTPRRR